MYLLRSHADIPIILFFLLCCEYWTGFSYHLKITSSAMLLRRSLFLSTEANSSDIDETYHNLNMSNNNLVEIKALYLDKLSNKSATVYIRTMVMDKYKNTTVVNRTDSTTNSLEISALANYGQNITFYVTQVRWTGRLGNLMFQYASLLGIARAHGRRMFVSRGTNLDRTFKLHHLGHHPDSDKWQKFRELSLAFDPKLMKLPFQNVRISESLQSFRYFKDVIDEVRQEFTFKDAIAEAADMILDDIHAKNRGSLDIGVHVRRGDFLPIQEEGYGVPEKSYFTNAFNWMKAKFPGRNITFLVASDDLNWCKANLTGDGVVTMPPASPSVHLAILANCDHVIISGGTFGWWGAWMADGYVIYYTGYRLSHTILEKWFTPSDYYLPLWIGLGN